MTADAVPGRMVVRREQAGAGTGHNIPRDRPDAVAGTILAVAAQAQPLA